MKVENGKLTCTVCEGKGAKLIRQQEDTAILQCKNCSREILVDTMKLTKTLFETAEMEGKILNVPSSTAGMDKC